MIVEGIKKGHVRNALCRAIQETGQLLLTHFSTIVGDTNELPDGVTIEHLKKGSSPPTGRSFREM
jgi:uncharacterized membrane protein